MFSVRDTGRGLDTEAVQTLYQPLRKATTDVRHHFSSAGLGLAIVRKLVTAMGGELRVETARGRGTRFFFALDLPVDSGAASAP
jgi:signal transduction histidine kinase